MNTVIFAASFISILSISTQLSSPCAYAAGKVDCDQVMSELNSGKTVAEVAKDMGVVSGAILFPHSYGVVQGKLVNDSCKPPGTPPVPRLHE